MTPTRSRALVAVAFLLLRSDVLRAERNGPGSEPPLRNQPTMAFQAATNRLLLFGGWGVDDSILGDVWEFDGARWARSSAAAPPARASHALTYDSRRNVVVVFGGETTRRVGDKTESVHLSDTWEWDGRTWTQKAASGPSPRTAHQLTYDPRRGKVVLFGGVDTEMRGLADTWEWDGERWEQKSASGPPARYHHVMVWDGSRGTVMLFGGHETVKRSTRSFGDQWEWDGSHWKAIDAASPPARDHHAMGYDAHRKRVVLFGGWSRPTGFLHDTWEWDGARWAQVPATGPSARGGKPAFAYDPRARRLLLYGGWGASEKGPVGDMWGFDGKAWTPVLPNTPSVRNGHALAYDPVRGKVVLFGGADEKSVRSDLWDWDGATWRPLSPAGPPARTFPALAYDRGRERLVLFGGNRVLFGTDADKDTFLDDMWEWHDGAWHEVKAQTPPARAEANMAYDAARRRLVLFGGYRTTGGTRERLGDTWEWDGERWEQKSPATAPSARNGAAMAYDDGRQRVVLFGGNGPSSETWEWDGALWQRVEATTPGRFNAAMAYDGARKAVVRFGGWNGQSREGDTWRFDGTRWARLDGPGPEPRNHASMAYDERRRALVLFGGHDGERVFGDTWEWRSGAWSRKALEPARVRIDNGH